MSSEIPVDPDKWVAVERGIAETVKVVSERLKSLEDEKARMPELVKQAEAILAGKGPRKRPKQEPSKSQLEVVGRLEAEGVPPSQRKREHREPAWWAKVEQLFVILRRNLVKDAAERVENKIKKQIRDFYSWIPPKALDELEHYRELKDAEEELAQWLLGYLKEPWLLNYVRASLIAQKPPKRKSITKEEAEGKFLWRPPMLEGYVFALLKEVEYPSGRAAVAWIAKRSDKPEPSRSTLNKTYAWQNRPQKTPKPRTTNEAQSGVSPAQNADAELSHEEVMDAVLDIEEELYRQLVDDERAAVAWTLQQAGAGEEERDEAIRQLIQGFRSGDM